MAYRNIYLSKPTTLSIEDANLRIRQNEVDMRVAVEDILSIMIDDPAVTMSSYLLSHLAQHDVLVYTTDRTHMPCALVTPFAFHTVQVRRVRQQIALSLPFHKQIWRAVIRAKIANQARCLDMLSYESRDLVRMSDEVKSGDSDGREGVVARAYFTRLFGVDFTRDQDTLTNACLNYGYAIMRGLVARSLVAHGFTPDLGIHHCSELNNFNLADDFIEPVRPAVDIVVAADVTLKGHKELSIDIKRRLYDIINHTISIDKETHSIGNAVDLMVESFVRCVDTRDPAALKIPVLLPPTRHSTT